mgnify:CR=1 FL=1
MTHQPPYRPDRPSDRSSRPDSAGRSGHSGRPGRVNGVGSADPHGSSDGYGEERRAPLPQEIYTRRRIAAVVVILALVALVVWALTAFARSGGDDAQETPTAPPSTLVTTPTEPNPGETSGTETATETNSSGTETASSDAAATEEQKPGESEGAEPTTKEDAEALAAKTTCELSDLQLTTELNKTAFAPGDPASERKFSVVIHNPTGGDCVIDTDENPLRFAAFSIEREGFQQIWSDTDCNKPMITGKETFVAGESRKFTAEWSGLDSAPQRCDARQTAAPGAYAAVGFLGENSSDPVTFNITG